MKLTIDTDNDEKKRVLFPHSVLWQPASHLSKVRVQVDNPVAKCNLRPWGCDYSPRERGIIGFETKRTLDEIYTNFGTNDRYRQYDSFARLRDNVKHGYVVFDFGWEEWHRRDGRDPGMLLGWAITAAHSFGLQTVGPIAGKTITTRVHLGETLIHLCLSKMHGVTKAGILVNRTKRSPESFALALDKAADMRHTSIRIAGGPPARAGAASRPRLKVKVSHVS